MWAVLVRDSTNAIPPPGGEELSFVAAQFEPFDVGSGQQPENGPIQLVERSYVDCSEELLGGLGHDFSYGFVGPQISCDCAKTRDGPGPFRPFTSVSRTQLNVLPKKGERLVKDFCAPESTSDRRLE
jgi:hypothetical protein